MVGSDDFPFGAGLNFYRRKFFILIQAKGSLPETFGELSRSLLLGTGRKGDPPKPQVVTRFLSNIWSRISMDCLGLPNSQPPISSNMITLFFLSKFSFGFGG